MSQFYDLASLVVIPSGYKASTIYAQKPLTTDGQLSFTRASGATRVASNGLIEKVRSNRFTYSQALANAAWLTTTDGGTITKTATAGIAPDGTNTATRIQIVGGGTYSLVYQSGVNPLGLVVISGYFKRYGSTNQTFRLFGDNGSALSSTLTATDTWQRFSYVMNATSTGADGIAADASNNAYDILVWGMQIETGDIATDYIPTTTAAVSVGPVSNVPRLDYLGSSCPRLLLEPQRTNLLTFSESFDNAAWDKADVTVTANTTISPDGTQNADTINATAVDQRINQAITVSASTQYTFSFYAKKGTMTTPRYTVFDLSNSAFILTQVDYSSLVNTSTWSRITATFTTPAGCTSIGIYPINGATTGTIFIWGAQLEAGAYATSYIPTLGASVTRVADAAYKTGVSSLIGQTEGVLYAEVQNTSIGSTSGSDNVVITIEGANFNDVVGILYQPFGTIYGLTIVGGALQTLVTANVGTTSAFKKIAFAYKANDFALYVDGVQVGTDTSGTVPTCSNLGLGQYYNGGSLNVVNSKAVKQALLFKTRLTNAQLAELTAL